MILGVGCDIVENARFTTQEHDVISRIFSKEELKESEEICKTNKAEFFGSRFAMREALAKASRIPVFMLNGDAVVIEKRSDGSPYVVCSDKITAMIKERFGVDKFKFHISLSHEDAYSVAYAVLES